MKTVNRRRFLQSSAGAAVSASLALGGGFPRRAFAAATSAPQWRNEPEKGAQLRVLRWKRFVQGDEDSYAVNVKKFMDQYGIPVRIESHGWEDVRPKASVAANIGAGPDIILSTNDDPSLYQDRLVDVTDLAVYLGRKYGGWYPVCEQYLKSRGRWFGLPLGAAGTCLVYRNSQVKAAGFDRFPRDVDGFLKLMRALNAKGTPGGFALGHATGDANSWTHWLLWAFGGRLVDEKGKVVINSPQTLKALEYAKDLYATFAPGTLQWLDATNNKAFIDGKVSLTGNGISVYYAAKTSTESKLKALAEDIQHANMPIGPIGGPAELSLFFNQMIFKHTRYPRAAKEFLRFMMEEEQYGPWLQASIGYVTQPLRGYEANQVWAADPKRAPFRDIMKVMRPISYSARPGYASAGVAADFVVVDMVADAVSGRETPQSAILRAENRARRYYKG